MPMPSYDPEDDNLTFKETTMTKTKKKLGPGDDAEMILSGNYPCWPMLPLKKPGYWEDQTGKKLGILFDEPRDKGWRIFHTNMFRLPGMSKVDWEKVEKTTYPSLEALLADGWIVD